ncbi:glycosyltransferase [Nocardia sp. NBC_01730]|uniref:glycosyltransferase n=1 Tax=Nocardia sp. NBC_01730 TaxID=2975998 RepID=UPI002E132BE4|nr:glycosyltransferase [Nocardia sp. NBC_01730]
MGRYLLAASPIPGHVLPLMTVACELRRRGHRVRLLTGAGFRDIATEHDVPLSELPGETHVLPVTRQPGRGLAHRWCIGRAELRSILLAPMVAQYAALSAELARRDFDAVLVDSMFSGAIPLLLSGGPRPPVLVCGVGPLTLSSADCPPFGVGWQPRPGRDYTAMNHFVQRVLFRTSQARLNSILGDLGIRPAPVFLLDWPILADRILQFTVPGFEYRRRDLPSSVVFTGPVPVSVSTRFEAPPWLDAVLRSGRRIVHVTQGTWDNGNADQLFRPALRALSQRPEVVVAVSTGGASVRLGPLPPHIHICDFVPYSHLLPHVDLMITNGGYGGVQQALSHGVPVIAAGDTADKPEVAARVAYTGVGIDLGGAAPEPADIAAAVDRVFGDAAFRVAAGRLGMEMARYTPFEIIASVLAEVGDPVPTMPANESLVTTRQEEEI